MTPPIPAFAVQHDEGVKLNTPTAGSVIVKADTFQTHGSMTVLEFSDTAERRTAGARPPP
jgi:hypothetical protein